MDTKLNENMQQPPVNHLAFEGGGVLGTAYMGALTALDQAGLYQGIQSVAGTSAGAITALMVALRLTAEEATTLTMQFDFNGLRDGGGLGIFRLFRRYGWYKGQVALDSLYDWCEKYTGNRRATFAWLLQNGYRDLRVVSTNLNRGTSLVFSADLTPDVEVALAVRMSLSIPFFFAAVDFEGDLYVDGGTLLNYPLEIFDRDHELPHTLGFALRAPTEEPVRIHGLLPFFRQYWHVSTLQQFNLLENDTRLVRRSVLLSTLGIKSTDFRISQAQKENLFRQGYTTTQKYLQEHGYGTAPRPE